VNLPCSKWEAEDHYQDHGFHRNIWRKATMEMENIIKAWTSFSQNASRLLKGRKA